MNILVINGSPKGEYSITLQTAKYLEIKFPEHSFSYLHAGQRIRALEKDFAPAKQAMENADLILFAYPVYTFIATSQLHRFFELAKREKADVRGKAFSQITTSKHFYDVTAHAYVTENGMDLGMKAIRGLSADMDDLLTERGREEAEAFFRHLVFSKENALFEPDRRRWTDAPLSEAHPAEETEKNMPGTVAIVTDCEEGDALLEGMVSRLAAKLPVKAKVINLQDVSIMGGCLGCFKCAQSGKCVWKDGFDSFLRNEIESADAIVYAFTIRDHSMGSRFKMFDDRRFCNGHRPVTEGAPIAYVVNGHLSDEANLSMILEARAQVGGNTLCGICTNETDPDREIDALALEIGYALKNRYTQPQNFYGVGGMKIFRDLIYLMRGMMKADHRYYKSHGKYDFPQKKKGTILKMYFVGALMSNEKLVSKMGNQLNEGMIAPYKKMFESLKK